VIRLPLFAAALIAVWWWLFHIAKWKSLRITLVAIAVALSLPLALFFAQWGYELYMMHRGSRISAQLEKYRSSHGRYPVLLSELGITETKDGIYYQRKDSSPSVYYLWFGTGFGTVAQYDSESRSWHGPE
jgi:hypothetical protein